MNQLADGSSSTSAGGVGLDPSEAVVRVPALRRFVAPVRGMTVALAAQCGLTVDEIEDLQMAVDEACSLLLPHAGESNPWLQADYRLSDGELAVEVGVPVSAGSQSRLDRDGLSWTVLTALADRLEISDEGQTLKICLIKRRRASQS
jgi:serine/threonine-protein kinase RsbW